MRRSLAVFSASLPHHGTTTPLFFRCASARSWPPQRPAPARYLHATPPAHNVMVLVGGLTVATGAMAARYALQVYERSQGPSAPSSDPGSDSGSASGGADSGSSSGSSSSGAADRAEAAQPDGSDAKAADGAGAAGGFSFQKAWGAEMMAKRFYRGGFEEKMTRREAALILGVRESATPERVRDRHRKMLMLNHPDMGGSTFLAEKVNEAKDYLLKGGGK